MIQFKHIRTRIAVAFLSCVTCLQLAGLIPMGYTLNHHANQIAENQIEIGERIFVNLLQHNTQNYKQAAQVMTSDYAFREALATLDSDTIQSVLSNYQARIHAEVGYYFSSDGSIAVSNGSSVAGLGKFNVDSAIKQYKTGALHFEIIDGEPYQLITVPVKAPDIIGWLLLGFKIDNQLSSQIKQLTNLDVTFIKKIQGKQWKLVDSTLPIHQTNLLIKTMADIFNQPLSIHSIQLDKHHYYVKTRTLYDHEGEVVLVVLQDSVTKFVHALDTLFNNMIGLTIIGLILFAVVAWYVSRVTVQPITELLKSAHEMTKGDYHNPIQLKRNDELGQLGQAFNEMLAAILERKERIKKLAFNDQLTGLSNRLSFMQALRENIESHAKNQQLLSVLVLNIDRFKPINTTLGRHFGDALLKHIAETLKQQVYSAEDLVARLDADEFAIMLHHTGQANATKYAEKINQIFEQPVHIFGQAIDVRMGIGIAIYPEHGEDEASLLHHAETAQQASKAKKSGWIVYNSSLELDQSETLNMISALQAAIKENQLLLYIQPKIDIRTRQMVGGEALIRWVHPEKGMVFPDQFIPFAEKTGVITQITPWMLSKACEVLAQFKQEGIHMSMAVNLSTRDLNHSDLPEQIASLLTTHQLSPDHLKLEITESSLMQDPERAEMILRRLNDMGLQIAIDDFGTGYSSLSYLRQLPVQALKIDKSFVMFMDKNPSDLAIVKSTIDLAHNLGLQVVAEGIENEDVLNQLTQLGCNEGQGYFIGKPMPVRDFSIWLERWQGESEVQLDMGENPLPITEAPALNDMDYQLDI